jgi:hypothetical protein
MTNASLDDSITASGVTGVVPDSKTREAAVPEPGSLSLLAIGALGLIRRRRAHQRSTS